jgi:hypothetical protein
MSKINDIFSKEAFNLEFYMANANLIPMFTDHINLFTTESNLDPLCIEKYINLGGNLYDICYATRRGNSDAMYEEYGQSAGTYACKHNDNRFLEMLQKYEYKYFSAILHTATQLDAIEQVKWLLKLPNINVNSTGHRGKTALYSAITRNNNDMIKLLLDNGANPNLKFAVCQYTYLDQAIDCYESVIRNSYEPREQLLKEAENIIDLLLERGAVTSKKTWPLLSPVKVLPPIRSIVYGGSFEY